MKLLIKRLYRKDSYTIGKLYIDGVFFCDTLEDKDRGLTQDMSIEEIEKIKVYGKTAIPLGTYELTMSIKSPKFSNFKKYKWAKICDGYIPRLLNVKGFDGILMHVANKATDIEGCIAIGENKAKGQVLNSTATFNKLIPILTEAFDNNEYVEITIEY